MRMFGKNIWSDAWDKKQGEEKNIKLPVHTSDMTSISDSPFSHHSYCDNVQMDSTPTWRPSKVAQEFAQAQERRWEEWKHRRGGRKGRCNGLAAIEAATKRQKSVREGMQANSSKYQSSSELVLY